MKTTKRILALFISLVLCIVPLPFTVTAHNSDLHMMTRGMYCSCENPYYKQTTLGPAVSGVPDDYVKTAFVCFRRQYEWIDEMCMNQGCGATFRTYNVWKEYTHPTFIYMEVDGEMVYRCPNCLYIR